MLSVQYLGHEHLLSRLTISIAYEVVQSEANED